MIEGCSMLHGGSDVQSTVGHGLLCWKTLPKSLGMDWTVQLELSLGFLQWRQPQGLSVALMAARWSSRCDPCRSSGSNESLGVSWRFLSWRFLRLEAPMLRAALWSNDHI